MPRHLDLPALRSFVAVAECGGVTRASGLLHLTQSAVSMQLKRLEEALDLQLLHRSGRGVTLTAGGEQLLSQARRLLELNDDILRRLTSTDFAGEITLGVPHDIVYPAIPDVLRRFAVEFPKMKVNLTSSYTRQLKEEFRRGAADVILTTEDVCDPGGETLAVQRLTWIGAPGGQAWKIRPLRLAFETSCIFRAGVQRRLDSAGIPWEMAVESEASRSIDASLSADLAVTARLEGSETSGYLAPVEHGGALPELTEMHINLYVAEHGQGPAVGGMADLIRTAYGIAPAWQEMAS